MTMNYDFKLQYTSAKIGFFLYNLKNKKRKVLLHKRDDNTKDSPNKWDCFGGKVEKGETTKEAFTRELCEELGITVRGNKVRLLHDICKENIHRYVFRVAFSIRKTREIRIGEGAGFAWFSIEDALKLTDLTDEAREDLLEFKKKVPTSSRRSKN